ncbi:hypothetical protein BHE74_00035994 [Ensete ventricosum]|nr:hypothetical protein GW17_00023898 [Ensete ventricosum]RWW57240.1 hypothetical protein BHE74_00035994 [Ensete ventricosum]RZS18284.1 hypothetical protein BHM03_00050527 [Ensete ventricosum]
MPWPPARSRSRGNLRHHECVFAPQLSPRFHPFMGHKRHLLASVRYMVAGAAGRGTRRSELRHVGRPDRVLLRHCTRGAAVQIRLHESQQLVGLRHKNPTFIFFERKKMQFLWWIDAELLADQVAKGSCMATDLGETFVVDQQVVNAPARAHLDEVLRDVAGGRGRAAAGESHGFSRRSLRNRGGKGGDRGGGEPDAGEDEPVVLHGEMISAVNRSIAIPAKNRPISQTGWDWADGAESERRRCLPASLFAGCTRRSQASQRAASSAQQKAEASSLQHTSHSIFIALLSSTVVEEEMEGLVGEADGGIVVISAYLSDEENGAKNQEWQETRQAMGWRWN